MPAIVVNPHVFAAWWAHVGRSPMCIWSDSNGAFQSISQNRSGDFHGVQRELRLRVPGGRLFRSGICPALTTDNGGTGVTSVRSTMIGLGESGNYEDGWTIPGAAFSSGADVPGATTWKGQGGSAFDEAILPSTINILNGGGNRYARWPSTNTPTAYIGGTRYIGCKATPISPFGEYQRALKAWFVFKKISGGGTVRPTIRRDGTGTIYGQAPAAISLDNSGAAALFRTSVDFTPSVNDGTTDSRGPCMHLSETGEADLSGDITLYWRYIEDAAIAYGKALDLVCALGSQSMRELAILAGCTDTGSTGLVGHSAASMAAMAAEQLVLCNTPNDGCIMDVVNMGMNDRNEDQPSVGPLAIADGDSPEAFVDNFDGWRIKRRAALAAAGYNPDRHYVLLEVAHALDPEDAELRSYFEAAAAYALANSNNVCVVDIARILPGSVMTANSYYDGAGQPHLTMAGYREKWRRIFDAMTGSYGRSMGVRGQAMASRRGRRRLA